MRGDDNDMQQHVMNRMTDNVIVIGMTLWNIERYHEMTDYDRMNRGAIRRRIMAKNEKSRNERHERYDMWSDCL